VADLKSLPLKTVKLQLVYSYGEKMSTDKRHAKFDITYIENDQIKIEMDGCSIVTEYFEDKDAKRTTMGSANIFFAAFAL
jgi:hypothetical protein